MVRMQGYRMSPKCLGISVLEDDFKTHVVDDDGNNVSYMIAFSKIEEVKRDGKPFEINLSEAGYGSKRKKNKKAEQQNDET